MESVTPKEKYTDCRLCGSTIGSYHPICQKCGLESNSAGIEELAKIEEQVANAVSNVQSLKIIASISMGLSLVNFYYYYLIDPQAVWFNLPLWVSYVYFGISYIKWNKKYSQIIFNKYDCEEIQKERKRALILIGCSVVSGFGLTILLR